MSEFDDETLMAFADGELDAATTAAVEAAMETDDNLAARVTVFMESRVQASAALKPLLDEPVPEALMQSVREMVDRSRQNTAREATVPTPSNVVTLHPRSASSGQGRWALALAASLAAAIIAGAGGYLAGRTGEYVGGSLAMASIGDPALARLLDTVPSGQSAKAGDAMVKLVSSFRDEAGTLCREFELASASTIISVACREQGRWDVRLAVAAPATGTDYVPAGAAEAVDTYLTSIHAGAPLSEADEAAALAGLQPR